MASSSIAGSEAGLYLVVPVAALGLYARIRVARDGLHVLSAICLVLHAAYMIRIGGDHFEFRPLDFYWPLLSVATVDGVLCVRARAAAWLASKPFGALTARVGSWGAAAVLAVLVLVYSTILQLGHIKLTHTLKTRDSTLRLVAEITPKTFPQALLLPGMSWLMPSYNAALRFLAEHSVGARYLEHRMFWLARESMYGAYAGEVAGLFPSDAVMKLGTIGVTSYRLPELTIIDTHGLTDRTVAHNPVTRKNSERQLAHDRSPPPGYLAERGVNIDVLGSTPRFGPSSEYALQLSDNLWMPITTTKPRWLRKTFLAKGVWRKHLQSTLERNEVWIDGQAMEPVRRLGFFDGKSFDDWTAEGDAFADKPRREPTKTQTVPTGYVGAGFLNTYHPELHDRAVGTLTSPTFSAVADQRLVFLVGGGASSSVGIELHVDGLVGGSWRGVNSEELAFVAYDLTRHAGKSCQVIVFDHSKDGWGHVLADHFMLMRPIGDKTDKTEHARK